MLFAMSVSSREGRFLVGRNDLLTSLDLSFLTFKVGRYKNPQSVLW